MSIQLPPDAVQVLVNSNMSGNESGRCLQVLGLMCEDQNTLPKSMLISVNPPRFGHPHRQGGFAAVFEGEYKSSRVDIKVMYPVNKELVPVNRFLGSCLGTPYLRCTLYRIYAEKPLSGDTYGTPILYP